MSIHHCQSVGIRQMRLHPHRHQRLDSAHFKHNLGRMLVVQEMEFKRWQMPTRIAFLLVMLAALAKMTIAAKMAKVELMKFATLAKVKLSKLATVSNAKPMVKLSKESQGSLRQCRATERLQGHLYWGWCWWTANIAATRQQWTKFEHVRKENRHGNATIVTQRCRPQLGTLDRGRHQNGHC